MEILTKYWSQALLAFGIIGYFIKAFFDSRFRKKELRQKYFYEVKAKKIIELHEKIVEIQMIIDREPEDEKFGSKIYSKRMALDRFYWDSKFYFAHSTQDFFKVFLSNLMLLESKALIKDIPNFEHQFDLITDLLLKEFKKEIL
jgi:hypothetical protein